MLSNGDLLGTIGTSLISLIAHNFKKPVIALCETYRFWDKVIMNCNQFDFLERVVKVEGNTSGHLTTSDKFTSRTQLNYENYLYLNSKYDITPAKFINLIVCELGSIPPTSVPVIIREFGQEDLEFDFEC